DLDDIGDTALAVAELPDHRRGVVERECARAVRVINEDLVVEGGLQHVGVLLGTCQGALGVGIGAHGSGPAIRMQGANATSRPSTSDVCRTSSRGSTRGGTRSERKPGVASG